jgi:hypothetical protein
MAGGFGAVPDELFKAASAITDAVGNTAGMVWRGATGDYGHAGVQEGWSQFIDDIGSEVKKLTQRADSHGENLRTTAVRYVDTDDSAGNMLGKIGTGPASNPNYAPGAVGGGFTGNLTPEQLNERFDANGGREGPAR